MKVATLRQSGGNGQGCLICELTPAQRTAVNAAIWDGDHRTAAYRRDGVRAYLAQTGKRCDVKVMERHVAHIEDTWREPTQQSPARPSEAPVFATDYKSIHDRAALLGTMAMDELERMIGSGTVEARELTNLAKMGVTARSNQEKVAAASKRPQLEIRAIFAIASGHAEDFPEHEIIDVTPVSDLHAEIASERRQLELLQVGGKPSEGNAFDALFEG